MNATPELCRLDLCPQCGYDLRGQRHPVSCPECGFAADARAFAMPLLGGRENFYLAQGLFLLIGFVLPMLLAAYFVAQSAHITTWVLFLAIVFLINALMVGRIGWTLLRRYRALRRREAGRDVVLISPQGLKAFALGKCRKDLSWRSSHLVELKRSLWYSTLAVRDRMRMWPFSMVYFVRLDLTDEQFIEGRRIIGEYLEAIERGDAGEADGHGEP